jgi:hypothetical protein
MLNIPRLQQKLAAAKSQFNDMPIADFNVARDKIALDEATAIVEEIKLAKVTVPGTGLAAGSVFVGGVSTTGNLT